MGREERFTQRIDRQPFKEVIGERLGEGKHSVVYALGTDWVVKELKSPDRQFDKEKVVVSSYKLLYSYLESFIPPTYFVRGENQDNQNRLFVVQKKIEGRSLKHVPWKELQNKPDVVEQLLQLTSASLQLYQAIGISPELTAFTIWKPFVLDMKASSNVLIDTDNKVWMVDTELIGGYHADLRTIKKFKSKRKAHAIESFSERLRALR